jgi:bifunctional DNase/RNase
MWIGTRFMKEFGPEYFWKKYENKYNQVLKDFKLQPSKAIHLAMSNGKPVGVRSLLRAL